MADIAPFRALRYDLSRVDDLASLAAPYDVVSDSDRAALEARDPHNVIRLELPRGEGDTKYQNARQLLDAWMAEGILRTDDRPAIYVYEQQFRYPVPGAPERAFARRGFFCRLRLEPFSARVVLPHEHTLAAPKEDRRKLMTATRTHLSQCSGCTGIRRRRRSGLVRQARVRARATFAVRAPDGDGDGTLWMSLRADADLSALGPPALRGLDVTVLHGLVLGPMLGIDAAAMARQLFLGYTHDTAQALADVNAGRAQAAFLMNATSIDQVLSACEAGFVLPKKKPP
ncbi:MAG: DUF1015 domain-containing protein, partial [Myxococcales bacterium]